MLAFIYLLPTSSLFFLQNVAQLKLLNTTVFPVQYSAKFYSDIVGTQKVQLTPNEELVKFAYFNGYVVGSICTRVESSPSEANPNRKRIYIMTLGTYKKEAQGKEARRSLLSLPLEMAAAKKQNSRQISLCISL
jgi:hypothetical protein